MERLLLAAIVFTHLFITAYSEEIQLPNEENNTTLKIKSVRNLLGQNNPIAHSYGQIRTGYITLKDTANTQSTAYALGGHYHLNSKKYYGWNLGLSAYTVLKLPKQQNNFQINNDFFNVNTHSFILLTKAFLKGKWDNTEVILGRQMIDTPHADPDDIRMIPNYFEAYTIRNNDIEDLDLQAGFIRKMAGWENGVDSSQFVNIGETLGTNTIDGVFYASARYDGIKYLSLSLWYYHYCDIAHILYTEANYRFPTSSDIDINFGLQYDASSQTKASLLPDQHARTSGTSIELRLNPIGINIFMAYNKDTSATGASSLNLGGGPLFTSMEDQTLDAMGEAGEAWVLGLGYDFNTIGIDKLNTGLAYGNFKSDKVNSYHAEELDAVIEYSFNDNFEMLVAYADVYFKTHDSIDYRQLRMIANYNF